MFRCREKCIIHAYARKRTTKYILKKERKRRELILERTYLARDVILEPNSVQLQH